MHKIEPERARASQTDQHREALVTPIRPRAGVRPRRVLSWVSAIAAVLLIALLTTALVASRLKLPISSTTPVPLAQLTVYGTSDLGTLRALRVDTGQVIWQAQTGTTSGGKPVVDHGIVYAGSAGTIYAFNKADGKLLWRALLGVPDHGPLVVGGVVYGFSITTDVAGNQTIFVKALRGSDGMQLWKTQVGSAPIASPGLLGEFVIDGVVYVAIAESSFPTGPSQSQFFVYVFHAADGHLLWRSQVTHPESGSTIGVAVDAQGVYVYADRVYAYSHKNGDLLWSSQGASASLGADPTSFSLQQGIVYVDTLQGVSAYQASDGRLLWQFAEQGQAMSIANGVVYTTAQVSRVPDRAFAALDGKTGKLLWRYEPAQPETFFPLVVGAGMVVGVKNQGMVALDAATGKLRWQTPVGGNGNAPVIASNTLFVGAFGAGPNKDSWGYTALNASDGKQLWSTPIPEGLTFPSALTVAP